MLSVEAFQLKPTEVAVSEVSVRPAGTVGGDVLPEPNVWNVATTAYQSVAVLSVARASCVPAAPDRMSSRLDEPPLLCARRVKFWPCEDPGVTVPGEPPVRMPPTTSSPAPIDPVGPESTVVLLPLATATWSTAPTVATPV